MSENNHLVYEMTQEPAETDVMMEGEEVDVEGLITQHSIPKQLPSEISESTLPQEVANSNATVDSDVDTSNASNASTEASNDNPADETENDQFYWLDQIMNPCLPPYKPNLPRNEPSVDFHECIVCGDRFLFESSLNFHMKRRSMLIIHHCKYRDCPFVSYNRCQFLAHLQHHSDTAAISVERLDIKVIPIAEELMAIGPLQEEDSDSPSIDQFTSPEAVHSERERVSPSMQSIETDSSEVSHDEIGQQMSSPIAADQPMQNSTSEFPTESILGLGSIETDVSGSSNLYPVNSMELTVEAGNENNPSSKEASGREHMEKNNYKTNTQVTKISQNYSTTLENIITLKKTSEVRFKSVFSGSSDATVIPDSSNIDPSLSSEEAVDEGDEECLSEETYGGQLSDVSDRQVVTTRQNHHPTVEHVTTQNNTSARPLESHVGFCPLPVEASCNQNVSSLLPSKGTNSSEVVIDRQGEKELCSEESSGTVELEASHDEINLTVMNIMPDTSLNIDSVAMDDSDSLDVASQPTDQANYLDEAVEGGIDKMSSTKESGGTETSEVIHDKINMQLLHMNKKCGQIGKHLLTQKKTSVLSETVTAFGSPESNAAENLEDSINAGGEWMSPCNKLDYRGPPSVNCDEIDSVLKDVNQNNCPSIEHLPSQDNTAEAETGAKCPECKAELTTDMRNHFQRGLRNLKHQYGCTECYLFLPNPCSLSAHSRYHRRQRPFVCPDCGCYFGLWSSFVAHLRSNCSHLDRFVCSKCPKCDTLFTDDMSLQKHILRLHVKLAFKCESCTLLCYQMAAIERHKIREHGRRDIQTAVYQQCQLCNVCVRPSMQIFDHVAAHIKKIYCVYGFKCTDCNILFEKRACFSAHRNKNGSSVSKIVSTDVSIVNNNIPSAPSSVGRSLLIKKAKDDSCDKNSSDTNNHSFFESNSSGSTSINNEGTVKKLSDAIQFKRPISPRIMQQRATTSLYKPIRQYANKSAKPGPDSNTKISQNCSSVTENVKGEVIRNSVVDKGSLSLEMENGRFIKISRIVRQCVSCKNDITFSGPSLQPLESLPTRCISCLKMSMPTLIDMRKQNDRIKTGSGLKKTMPTLINMSTHKSRMKTVICAEKIEKPNVISAASFTNSADSQDLDQNTENEGNLVNSHQTTSTAENDCTTEFEDGVAENATEEPVEESTEHLASAPKHKRIKLIKKEKTSASTTFASGGLTYPVTEIIGIYKCIKCDFSHSKRSEFEKHVFTHTNDSSSFQCMECGMCFSMRPSLEEHLLASHNITGTEKYIIDTLNCNDDSGNRKTSSDEEADENRCSICHVVYDSSEELNNHFRSHGMAFLLKKRNELAKNMTP